MMPGLCVVTNNVPRFTIDAFELTTGEREEFDYVDWTAVDNGEDSRTFFRFRGALYDLGEFTADYGITKGAGLPDHLSRWDGYMSETAFSAVVVRLVDNGESVVVGRVFS